MQGLKFLCVDVKCFFQSCSIQSQGCHEWEQTINNCHRAAADWPQLVLVTNVVRHTSLYQQCDSVT